MERLGMRSRGLWAALTILLLAAIPAFAADTATTAPSEEQQYEAIAAARTRLELALRRIHKTMGDAQTQWMTQSALLDQTRMRIAQMIDKARESEMRKDENDRSQAYLDELRDRHDQIDDQWQKFVGDDRARMERDFHRSQEIIMGLNGVLPNLAGLEHTYKDLGMDLNTVRTVYEAFASKADEAADMGQKSLDDLAAARKVWTGALEDAKVLARERPKKDKGTP
jgi:hypothetical protein